MGGRYFALADSTSVTVSMPPNVTLNAIFEPSQVAINVITNGSGSVSGAGNYNLEKAPRCRQTYRLDTLINGMQWMTTETQPTVRFLN